MLQGNFQYMKRLGVSNGTGEYDPSDCHNDIPYFMQVTFTNNILKLNKQTKQSKAKC